jgi:hypothetical protein
MASKWSFHGDLHSRAPRSVSPAVYESVDRLVASVEYAAHSQEDMRCVIDEENDRHDLSLRHVHALGFAAPAA